MTYSIIMNYEEANLDLLERKAVERIIKCIQKQKK